MLVPAYAATIHKSQGSEYPALGSRRLWRAGAGLGCLTPCARRRQRWIGSISHGQGHATIQTQILVDRLGVDPNSVKFIQGDTDAVAFGMGTGGSRSTTMSGGAIVLVSDKIIAKGRKLAAHIL